MKQMKVKLKVAHSIPGRTRIKIETSFDPKVFFFVLEAGLREIKEIKKCELNPYSKSITLYFKKNLKAEVVLDALREVLNNITEDPAFPDRLEDIKEALTYGDQNHMDVSVRNKILKVSRNLDHTVRHMTGNTVDMRTALPVSSFASGIAALLIAPGVATPAWLVLLTFGITSFQLLKHDHPRETDAADPAANPQAGISQPDGLPEKASESAL